MMKVLVGMPSKDSWGGPIYCEPIFVDALRNSGVEVDEEEYVYGVGAREPGTLTRVRRVLAAAFRLRKRLRSSTYDIVHLNTSIDEKCVLRDLTTLWLIGRTRVPVHLKMHGSDARFLKKESRIWKALRTRLFRAADDIGVLSTEERDNFLAAGCPSDKLSNAIYATDAAEFRKRDDFRKQHGIGENAIILLFSARFIPAKGLLDTIEAVGRLASKGYDVVLYCLGDGPQRSEAEKAAASLKLGNSVRFTGYISEAETADFHANADIFVFPSYHDEGFPLVLLKSIAAGTPIVTSRIRAAADHLKEAENCLFVRPKDPDDVAEKVAALIDNPELAERIAANNRRLAEKFSPKMVADHYLRTYRTIIAREKEVRLQDRES